MMDRRKKRHIISGLLAGLMAVTVGFLLLTAIFYFGSYSSSLLSQSFEKSGYYLEKKEETRQEITRVLREAGIPETLFEFSEFEDDFEQKMRSQVYGRNDRIPELESISVAGSLHKHIEELKVRRTLRSEKGTLKLADRISGILLDNSIVPGIADWWEKRASLKRIMELFMAGMMGMLLTEGAVLWFLQSRKFRTCYYMSAGLFLGCLSGILETLWFYRSWEGDPAGVLAGVWEIFRKGILSAGLECCAVIFLAGVILAAVGKVLSHSS